LAADNKTTSSRVDYKKPVPAAGRGPEGRRGRPLKPNHLISPRDAQPAAPRDHGLGHAGLPQPRSGTALRKTDVNPLTEARLIRAYLNLFLVPRGKDGARTTSLARFGCYEVRLFELAPDFADDVAPLWMELYAHHSDSTLDSFGCDDFEAAVRTADEFMTRAKALHEQRPAPTTPSGWGEASDPFATRRLGLSREVLALLRDAGFTCDLMPPDDE
jgi:hypothetical protein